MQVKDGKVVAVQGQPGATQTAAQSFSPGAVGTAIVSGVPQTGGASQPQQLQQQQQQQLQQLQPPQPRVAGIASETPHVWFPHAVLSTEALVPTAKKLPFLALALVGVAILLLGLGAVPARRAPHPMIADLLIENRGALALGGMLLLVASIFTYLVV